MEGAGKRNWEIPGIKHACDAERDAIIVGVIGNTGASITGAPKKKTARS